MERLAAMVAGRRAATAPKEGKKGEEERDVEYMRIQLEEIVIVKDDALAAASAAAAHSRPNANANGQFSSVATPTGTASTSMENCARAVAMVAGRRATTAPKEGKKGEEEWDAEYMRIQLEEIVIVKDDAYDALAAASAAAAHSRPNANANGQFSSVATPTGTASTSMENCARAVEAARGGMSTGGTAAQGAWATAARGPVGFD